MRFDSVASKDFICSNTTVISTLRWGESHFREG